MGTDEEDETRTGFAGSAEAAGKICKIKKSDETAGKKFN
jgi:hypothetical protein